MFPKNNYELMAEYNKWMDTNIYGVCLTPRQIGKDLFDDFEDLRAAQEKTDFEILDWAQSLTPEILDQPFDYVSNVENFSRKLPIWVLATHMFNHQTHHRGQVTTLIKQLGYEPGITDLPWLPCLENYSTSE